MEKLNLPDLTETEARSFLFYQVPQALIDDEAFSDLDGWAIILYSLMLNRAGLSVKNSENSTDDNGRLYIIFTIEEVIKKCRCGKNVAIKLVQQLEDIGLIEKKRQGLGKPSLIYVKDFSTMDLLKSKISASLKSKKCTSENLKNRTIRPPEVQKVDCSNTNLTNHTNLSHSDKNKNQSINQTEPKNETSKKKPTLLHTDSIDTIDTIELIPKNADNIKKIVANNISLDMLLNRYPLKKKEINELYELTVEALISKKPTFRIAKEDLPASIVKQAFSQINSGHIEYVLECLANNTTEIKSIKSYLQTALYNSVSTIENYYTLGANQILRRIITPL